MANNKHLSLDNRSTIELMLNSKHPFKEIGTALDKDPTTISKEIRNHLIFRRIGGMHICYNSCRFRSNCTKNHLCNPCHSERKYRLCKSCSMCNSFCKDFSFQICERLSKPPYVCNGCSKRYSCSLEKRMYIANDADKEYHHVLSESRTGSSLSESEIQYLNQFLTPLIRKGQSPHHICSTNRDSFSVSERTIYRLIDSRTISASNIDLPRKVRYSARKNRVHTKIDRACRIGRNFDDFHAFMIENPDFPVVQLDSVEGIRGGKVLLTIHFEKSEMMLAFLREHNDSRSVIDIFEKLYLELRPDRFMDLFKVCLTDNGTEFSNPKAIEYDLQGNPRTKIFYCNPSAPYQKGSAERNHEFIRCFIPKGTDFALYTQHDIHLMMDHINSYHRKSLGNKCPYEMFSFLYGQKIMDLLECHMIPPQEVTLNRSIFSKEAAHENR